MTCTIQILKLLLLKLKHNENEFPKNVAYIKHLFSPHQTSELNYEV